MNVVFDLDGTLALHHHRRHFIEGENKDWRSYFDTCDEDKPNMPIVNILHELCRPRNRRHHVEIWTGRSEGKDMVWREKTVQWLLTQADIFAPGWPNLFEEEDLGNERLLDVMDLKMRPYKDYRSDVDLKRQWLCDQAETNYYPALVFEDRQKVVDMYRSYGITCVQVAPNSNSKIR